MTKVWIDKAKGLYKYKTGEYIREKLAEKPKDAVGYRIVEVKPGVKVLVALTRRRGPRGGRTKAVALLRHLRHWAQVARRQKRQK